MATTQLRYGRLALLIVVVAFVAGAAVEAVRTVPDPNLFTSATGTIVTVTVAGAVIAATVLRPPSWLTRNIPFGATD